MTKSILDAQINSYGLNNAIEELQRVFVISRT